MVLRRRAERSIADAAADLSTRSASAAPTFVEDTNEVLRLITTYPEIGRITFDTFRSLQIGRSSYGLFYVVDDAAVIVFGVFHLARDPEMIRRILRADYDL